MVFLLSFSPSVCLHTSNLKGSELKHAGNTLFSIGVRTGGGGGGGGGYPS